MKDGLIFGLESALLDPSTRQSREKLDALIADDFVEFGSSSQIYTKSNVLNSLPFESPRLFKIKDFKTTFLSEDVILATYRIQSDAKHTLRSSIWKLMKGEWKMVFHQGTRCGD